MKLVELLARELSEWPNGVVSIDRSVVDGELYGRKIIGGPPVWRKYLDGAAAKIETLGGRVSHSQWRVEREQVISQPQAEQVEMKGPFVAKAANQESTEIELDDFIKSGAWYEGQIDGPIKWRDRIVELEAHEEDIQREIASLHARLTSEGFQLIRQYPSGQQTEPSVDMSDWRNWMVGDIVECITTNHPNFISIGTQYPITDLDDEEIHFTDDDGDTDMTYSPESFKFVRRP